MLTVSALVLGALPVLARWSHLEQARRRRIRRLRATKRRTDQAVARIQARYHAAAEEAMRRASERQIGRDG